MNIYLLRHGEVENPKNVLYGRLPNFHLSEEGREHIQKTAQKFIGKNIKKIYSSPLERAVETSKIVLEVLGLKETDLIIDERLIESDLSKWQGTPVDEFRKMVISRLSVRTQKEFELITHSGARIMSVMNGPIKKAGQDVIIVSHGDPLVGVLINITGDWSFIEGKYIKKGEEIIKVETKYIKKGEFVKLNLSEGNWRVEGFSY